jgi:hypothetical protein
MGRTGKSFLLNQLVDSRQDGAKEGFQVGGTVNACTKGIWLWGEPVVLDDGTSVLFLDTEGLGSTNRASQTHDCRVFALALLLCSCFVYNSRGTIDGNALDDLSLVVNLTKHIHVQSSDDKDAEDSGTEFEKFFPSFLWIVRDFTLKLNEDGRDITPRQYLDNALQQQGDYASDEETIKKDRIRMLLKDFFRNRDCVTLVRPADEEEDLRDLTPENTRPEFVEGVRTLKGKLFGPEDSTCCSTPKTLHGHNLDGAMLITLAEAYVTALNQGAVPAISSAWERLLEVQSQEAVQEAKDEFKKEQAAQLKRYSEKDSSVETQNTMPVEQEDLDAIHARCKGCAMKAFRQKLVQDTTGGSGIETQAETELSEAFSGYYDEMCAENLEDSHAFCEHLLAKLHKVVLEDTSFRDGISASQSMEMHIGEYQSAIQNLLKVYPSKGRGPAKWSVLAKFELNSVLDDVSEWVSEIAIQHAQELAKIEENMHEISRERAELKGEMEVRVEVQEMLQAEFNRAKEDALTQAETHKRRMADLTENKQGEIDRLAHAMELLEQSHKTTCEGLNEKAEGTAATNSSLTAKFEDAEKQWAAEREKAQNALVEAERRAREDLGV